MGEEISRKSGLHADGEIDDSSVYDFSVVSEKDVNMSLKHYEAKVLLIVNMG